MIKKIIKWFGWSKKDQPDLLNDEEMLIKELHCKNTEQIDISIFDKYELPSVKYKDCYLSKNILFTINLNCSELKLIKLTRIDRYIPYSLYEEILNKSMIVALHYRDVCKVKKKMIFTSNNILDIINAAPPLEKVNKLKMQTIDSDDFKNMDIFLNDLFEGNFTKPKLLLRHNNIIIDYSCIQVNVYEYIKELKISVTSILITKFNLISLLETLNKIMDYKNKGYFIEIEIRITNNALIYDKLSESEFNKKYIFKFIDDFKLDNYLRS